MNKIIWKYILKNTDTQVIEMPMGAKILSIQNQDNHPCLWALVTDDKDIYKEKRVIEIIGTGNPIAHIPEEREFIGTFQIGSFVGHVFERIN